MRILYGVQTTGNGHINRSCEVIRELKSSGHPAPVIFSDRKKSRFMDLEEFEILHRLIFWADSTSTSPYYHR